MIVGVPKEIKDHEDRVALTPAGTHALVQRGHRVLVQSSAGQGSGFGDEEYRAAGAELLDSAPHVWQRADLVVKVKEPLASEYELLRADLTLFTYLHLAANETLACALLELGTTGIAYETVQSADGHLPLLTPMSEIAGRMSVQLGARYLEKANGGQGKLLGGVPGVAPARVVILGGGIVGANAAKIALGMGAHVTLLDINLERLRYLSEVMHGNFETLASDPQAIAGAVKEADLLIGAVLVPGAKAPRLVTREMIGQMQPGAVVIDVAVDQGGCIETCHPTSHSQPTYEVDGVIHYTVPNIPGAVPRTATLALGNATLPFVLRLADNGVGEALRRFPDLATGVNTYAGHVTCRGVAEALARPFTSLDQLL